MLEVIRQRVLSFFNVGSITPPVQETTDVGEVISEIGVNGSAADNNAGNSVAIGDLPQLIEDWLKEYEYQNSSVNTISNYAVFLNKLLWFLRKENVSHCGTKQLKDFMLYLRKGHEDAGGRWGNPRLTQPLRPVTITDYYVAIRAFFNWLVQQERIPSNPMSRIPRPRFQVEQKTVYSREDIEKLIQACGKSKHPLRNECLLLVLYDCGLRAGECEKLQWQDVDLESRQLNVVGKGNKKRSVPFAERAAQSLEAYQAHLGLNTSQAPVFPSDQDGEKPLTRSGLGQLLQRLGKAAGLNFHVTCHGFRRSFATEYIKGGGGEFQLQMILGHSDLQMTRHYVALAQADIQDQHRRYSPADRLKQDLT